MFLCLLCVKGGKVIVESVQVLLPEAAVSPNPFGDFPKWGRLKAAGTPLGIAAASNQTGTFEDLEVLGNRGCADRKGLSEFFDRGFSHGQTRQDGAARWV